jgi:heme-degrading monooxygenase HmoA
MHARMTRLQASPDRLDEMARQFQEQTVPLLEGLDGFRGYLLLGDRAAGPALAVTLWESEEAMRASEEAVQQARRDAAQAAGATGEPTVERFEVVAEARR